LYFILEGLLDKLKYRLYCFAILEYCFCFVKSEYRELKGIDYSVEVIQIAMPTVLKLLRRGNARRARDSRELEIVEFAGLSSVERTKLVLIGVNQHAPIRAESNKLESK